MTNDLAEVFDPHQERWRTDVDTFRAEQLDRRIEMLRRNIPSRFHHATATASQVSAWIESFLHGSNGSLLILGPTGIGKTHEACGAVFAVASRLDQMPGRAGAPTFIFTTAADLYGEMRPRAGVDSEDVFRARATSKLLLLDDLGASKTTDWTEEINYRLVNYRYNHEMPTIITSNCTPKHLADQVGERVASRLTEMCTTVVLKGSDRRAA